ncbi:MAG: hypothetical protein RLZ35_964 [Pseudomonadota bacterium]|jgi:hypothetical protein
MNLEMKMSNEKWTSLLDKLAQRTDTTDTLDLSHQDLQDNNILELCEALQDCYYVRSLDLSSNHIGDQGAIALAQSRFITYLDLSYNVIGDEGAIALSQSQSINKLDIALNNLTNKGIIVFLQNQFFISLDISANPLVRLKATKEAQLLDKSMSYNRAKSQNEARFLTCQLFSLHKNKTLLEPKLLNNIIQFTSGDNRVSQETLETLSKEREEAIARVSAALFR